MSGLLGLNIFSQTLGIKMQKIGFRKKGNSLALGCAEMLGSCGSSCTNGKSLRAIETAHQGATCRTSFSVALMVRA